MKLYLLSTLFLFSSLACAEDPVFKTELAVLVESAVKETGLNINIPPNRASETSLEISRINGKSVCDHSIENEVRALQNEFIKNKDMRLTYSIYGAYTNNKGKIKYLPPADPSIKKIIGECINIYVSVY